MKRKERKNFRFLRGLGARSATGKRRREKEKKKRMNEKERRNKRMRRKERVGELGGGGEHFVSVQQKSQEAEGERKKF